MTTPTTDHGQQHGDTRTAQIQAVRDVMGWGFNTNPNKEFGRAQRAAELVDAVTAHANAGPTGWEGVDRAEAIRQADTNHADLLRTIRERDSLARRCAVRFEETERLRDQLDQAEARGYQRAVANLRDLARYAGWHRQQTASGRRWDDHPRYWLADYLDAVGPARTPQTDADRPGVDRPSSEAETGGSGT